MILLLLLSIQLFTQLTLCSFNCLDCIRCFCRRSTTTKIHAQPISTVGNNTILIKSKTAGQTIFTSIMNSEHNPYVSVQQKGKQSASSKQSSIEQWIESTSSFRSLSTESQHEYLMFMNGTLDPFRSCFKSKFNFDFSDQERRPRFNSSCFTGHEKETNVSHKEYLKRVHDFNYSVFEFDHLELSSNMNLRTKMVVDVLQLDGMQLLDMIDDIFYDLIPFIKKLKDVILKDQATTHYNTFHELRFIFYIQI